MQLANFEYAEGATPLDPNEITGLIPAHIMTQEQLNEWEELNIIKAENWAFTRKHANILELNFCLKLHKKMFGNTWDWAGQFRQTNKNIGIFWEQISTQLNILFDDIKFQLKFNTYPTDELAARFHHRLVYIHPFINGNGRHARLMTDILLFNNSIERFSWGKTNLVNNSATRKQYISALRSADKGSYQPLFDFVRS